MYLLISKLTKLKLIMKSKDQKLKHIQVVLVLQWEIGAKLIQIQLDHLYVLQIAVLQLQLLNIL